MAEAFRRSRKGSGEMKRRWEIWLICALGVLCGCAAPAEEEAPPVEETSRDVSMSIVSQAPDPGAVEKLGVQYVYLEGALVGAWEQEGWHSAADKEDALLSRSLEEPVYYTYSAEQYLGAVEEVTVGEAPEGEAAVTVSLPVEEERTAEWKDPRFGGENCVLAVSEGTDCLPSVVQWKSGDAVSQEDLVAVQQTVARDGLSQALEIQTAVVDFDGDGKQETYIFANTAAEDQKEQAVLVLMREEDSRVETVYARFRSQEEQEGTFALTPMGIYDLNGDRSEEICLKVQEGELVSRLVVSRVNGRWEIVLCRDENPAP